MKLSASIRKKGKRILAVALAVLMVNSVMDYSGILTASAKTKENRSITAFAELDEDIAFQKLPIGAKEADINFPDTLTVTISTMMEETSEAETTEESTTEESTTEENTTEENTSEEESKLQTEENLEETEKESLEQTGEESSASEQTIEEPSSQDLDTQKSEEEAEAIHDESTSAKADTLVSNVISAFAPMTVYAAETESEDETESKNETESEDDTEEMTEEITLTGITWKLDIEESCQDTFDSGITPEEYFGVDEEGKVNYAGATQEKKDAFVDRNGAYYTYVAVLPDTDADGNTLELAEGVELPRIEVLVGENGIMLYSTTHTYDGNGFCTETNCEHPYRPAELVSGTYEIANAGNLYWFAELVNTGTTDVEGNTVAKNIAANARLTADITVNTGDVAGCNGTKENSWREWTAIANTSVNADKYTGTFDGKGHFISGLYADVKTKNFGLIGATNSQALIQNVGVVNFYFKNEEENTGGICGYLLNATINNCYSAGTINGVAYFGGIVGYNTKSSIINCFSRSTVAGGTTGAAAFCGRTAEGSISNSYYDRDRCDKSFATTIYGITIDSVVDSATTGGFTTAQFASGETAYTMNTNAGETIWYQTIGSDAYPVLDSTHKIVYRGQNADGTYFYSNSLPNEITAVEGKTSKVYDATPFIISTDKGGIFSWTGSGTATIEGYFTKGEDENYIKTTVEGSGATEVGGAPVNAGTYYVKIDVPADDTYMAAAAYLPITISQATGTISNLSITGWTYGEAANSPTVESNSNAPVKYEYKVRDTEDTTYAEAVPQVAGTYILKVTYPANTNYTEATATTEFTIAKKTVTPSITGTAQKTYDGTTGVEADDLKISLAGVITGDVSNVGATADYAYASANKGTGITVTASNITLTGDAAGNYVLSKDTLTTTGTITAKEMTDAMVTGLGTTYYYTGSAIKPTVTVSDVVGGTALLQASDYEIAYADNTAVGTNTATITVTGKGNYTGTVTKTFTIAYITAPTNYISGTAGTNDWYTSDVTIEAAGWQVSQNGTAYTQNISVTTEGTHSLTLSFKNADGQITEAQNVTIKIDQTLPTGKITVASKWWENALRFVSFGRYQATTKTVTITGGDTGSGVADSEEGSTISYAIVTGDTQYTTVEALEAAAAANASFWTVYNGGSKPSISANGKSVIYAKIADQAGNYRYVSSDGMLFDETAPVISDAAVSTEENDITDTSIKFNFKVNEAGNYYYVVLPSTADAPSKAADVIATVKADALGAADGTALTNAAASGSGTVQADSYAGLEGTATGLSANTAYKSYIVATDVPMTNIDTETETQTVNVSTVAVIDNMTTKKTSLAGATITLTESEGFVYDGTEKTPSGITVKLGNTTLDASQYTVSYTNSNSAATSGKETTYAGTARKETTYAGTVTVTVRASDTGNYSGTVTEQKTYVIAPKPLTAQVTATSRVYDGTTAATVSATVATGITNEALTITGLTGAFADASAGTGKTVNIDSSKASMTAAADSTATEPSNYQVTYPTGINTGVITQAAGTITIGTDKNTISKTFGEAAFALTEENFGITHTGDGTLTYTVTDSKNAAGTGVADNQVITVAADGTVTIVGTGTATITLGMAATTNYTAAENKTIAVTIGKKTASTITAENRSYAYSVGSRNQAVEISMAEKLPMDRGNTTYSITNQADTNSILSDVSVNAAGQLSYQVLADKTIGNTASITVTASMDNYADTTFTVNISITDKIPVAVKNGSEVRVTGNSILTYGQSLSALTLNTSGLGKAVFVEQGTNTEVEGTLAWTGGTTKPEATAEGTSYAAEWTFTPSDTAYEGLTGTVAITVNKAAGTVEDQADSAGYATNYTFTGNEIAAPVSTQFTTNSGSTGFTFTWYQGSVSDANKLADNTRPSAVGKYVLKVDVAENANYTAATKNVPVEIQKFTTDAAATLTDTNAGTDGWYHADVTIHAPAGYTISTTQSPLAGFAGSITVATDMNGSYPYYLKQDGTGYLTEAMTITVKKDTTAPTAGIQVKQTWWQSFLETVTFGLYTNDMDTITIKAEDTAGAAHSGIQKIEYYISSTAYVGDTGLTSLKALRDTVWTAYNSGSKPTVLQNQVSYVYVRVTDKAGNVNYVSTNGIVQDKTAPTLTLTPSGTAYTDTSSNQNTYTGTVTVAVTASDAAVAGQDTLEAVTYVLDQGTAQSVTSGGTISITGNGVHTLTATAVDKAGNQTVKELTTRI